MNPDILEALPDDGSDAVEFDFDDVTIPSTEPLRWLGEETAPVVPFDDDTASIAEGL